MASMSLWSFGDFEEPEEAIQYTMELLLKLNTVTPRTDLGSSSRRRRRVSRSVDISFQLDEKEYMAGLHFPFHILKGRSGRMKVPPVPVPLPSPKDGTRVAASVARA